MFEHFVDAQDPVYQAVLAELRAGQKTTHWMWFIFPQLTALGRSPTALRFGLDDLDAARAYLAHPVVGSRLVECTEAVNAVAGRSVHQIFGTPDDRKLRSSMTLFAHAAVDPAPFRRVLEKYYEGIEDPLTLAVIGY